MDIKTFIVGVLIGAAAVGGAWWFSTTPNVGGAALFANKEKCASYTQKRQIEEEMDRLTYTYVTVQGFYSPTANTCMTEVRITSPQHFTSRSLIDELTGQKESYALEIEGQDWLDMSIEDKKSQIDQVHLYTERLKYFKGL